MLTNGHRVRINVGNSIRTELGEEGYTLRIDCQPVRQCVRSRRGYQRYFSGTRYQSPDHVTRLYRKPQYTLLVKDRCMRIAGPGIGHPVFDDTTRPGVELADIRRIIRGKPDVAGRIRNQPVRSRVGNLRS